MAADPFVSISLFADDAIEVFRMVIAVGAFVAFVGLCLFVAALYRLATQTERSPKDKAIVAIGIFVMVQLFWSPILSALEGRSRSGQEEQALHLISQATGRIDGSFTDGRWIELSECDLFAVDLVGHQSFGVNDMKALDNRTVREDAAKFEAAGWVVTRYAPRDWRGSTTRAFRADRGEHAVMLYDEWGDLAYVYLSSDCPPSTGHIGDEHIKVEKYPHA